NILLIYLRDEKTKYYIEETHDPMGAANTPIISVVSVGEIKSIAKRNKWGARKVAAIEQMMRKLVITDIKYADVIDRYAEIDTYSQDKFPERRLGTTARNMGKNDLWIAATGSVLGATLLTTDNDFNYLNNKYLKVLKIDRRK
ncbi:MAG: PIN domain-containing protein, partial [Bacteroidota bacterium]